MRLLYLGVVILTSLFGWAYSINCIVPVTQYSALQQLFIACRGEYWKWNASQSITTQWSFPSLLSDPCSNNWQGLTCQDLNGSCSIISINLSFMNLTGYMPDDIGNFTSLQYLDLGSNNIVSTIPQSIGKLQNLTYLKLHDNYLTGSLPVPMFELPQLGYLNLDSNPLTGTIPTEIGNLQNLTTLHLSINSLNGWIPTQFGSLTKLVIFDLSVTQLSGTIPSELGNLGLMAILSLQTASLIGSIPSELGQCAKLLILYLNNNYLEGSIPSSFVSLSSLQYLALNYNYLDGEVPIDLPKLPSMINLQLNNNFFNGTNMLMTGISESMNYLILGVNFFTGTIPNDWTSFRSLQTLYLNGNLLTGTIPTDLTLSTTLLQLSFSQNSLHGTIPDSIGNVFTRELNLLTISDNKLTGTLPSSLALLRHLQTLNISSNSLTGPITQIFPNENVVVFPNMTYLFLDHNGLAGTISASLFTSSKLEVIALNSNCFSGTLPTTICSSPVLEVFAFSAASAGPMCWLELPKKLRVVIGGVFRTRKLTSPMPSCLWEKGTMRTLHLSANAITGTIPDVPMPTGLINVEIGYNDLTGTVPYSLQTHGKFQYLTLRHNKFTGTLAEDYDIGPNKSDIQLFVNRLSGPIPSAFFGEQSTINMLNGNLFACTADNEMPPSDPNSRTYSCGSSNYNQSWYLWVGWFGGFLLLGACLFAYVYYSSRVVDDALSRLESNGSKKHDRDYESQRLTQTILNKFQRGILNVYNDSVHWYYFQLSPDLADKYQNTLHFLQIMKRSTICVGMAALFFFLVVMFAYVIMKYAGGQDSESSISTVYLQYAWVTTSSYMHGAAPAVLVSVGLFIGVLIMKFGMYNNKEHSVSVANDVTIEDKSQILFVRGFRAIYMIRLGIQFINAIVTLGVNAVYVVVVENGNITPREQFFVEIAVTAFKLAWGAAFIPFTMKYFVALPAGYRLCNQVFMYCILLIMAPLSAAAVTSESCFIHIFQPAPTIQVSYAYTQAECVETANFKDYDDNGLDTVQFSTQCSYESIVTNAASFDQPPFNYSFQCGSTILAFYLPILVYSFIFSSMILPAIRFSILHLYRQLRAILPLKFYRLLVSDSLLDCEDILYCYGLEAASTKGGEIVRSENTITLVSSSPEITAASDSHRLFDGTTVISKRLVDIAVILTFGLASPILGVAVLISVAVNSYIWFLMVNKYLSAVTMENEYAYFRLEVSTRGLLAGCQSAMWVVILVCCGFWSIMLYDMVADVYHDIGGMIAAILILIAFPTIIYFSVMLWTYQFSDDYSQQKVVRESEMRISSTTLNCVPDGSIEYRESVSSVLARPTTSMIRHNSEFL